MTKNATGSPKKTLTSSAVDGTSLVRAIELGLVAKVKTALAQGVDPNGVVRQKYGVETRPLWVAAKTEHAGIVGLLLDAGARLNERDEYGRAALHQARYVAVVERLLDAGADIDARDARKQTALHHASEWGDTDADVVELLVSRGAQVDAEDESGKTPFLVTQSMKVRAILKAHGARGLANTDGRPVVAVTTTVPLSAVEVDGGAVAVDEAGHLWVGGSKGLYRCDGDQATSFVFRPSISVSAVAVGAGGTMYFASNSGLLVLRDGAFRLYTTKDSELHDDHIVELAVDRLGRAHVLGYGAEEALDRPISRFDGGAFSLLVAGRDFPAGLETKCIGFDEDNALVLGTSTGVVFTSGSRPAWAVPGERGTLAEVGHLAPGAPGCMWAGAWRGAHRIEADGSSTHVRTPDGVKALCVDGPVLWIGMSYGGLLRVEGGETQLFKPESSGLTASDVEGLALGRDGTLWIAAERKVFACRDRAITPLAGAAPTPPAAAPAPARKRRAKALPTEGFVRASKIPSQVASAVKAAEIPGLPAAALLAWLRPSIGLVMGRSAPPPGTMVSKVGGRPDLAEGISWPTYRSERGRYVPHLLQVDLAAVAQLDLEGLLPKRGMLSFFCDTAPDEIEDSRVLHGTSKLQPQAWPADLVERKREDDFVAQLPERTLDFYLTWTLPSREYLSAFAELSDASERALESLRTAIRAQDPKGASGTRMLGWPDSIQDEVVRGADPIVLLQVDAGMKATGGLARLFEHWGGGVAHFLVKRAHLAEGKLAKVRAELAYT